VKTLLPLDESSWLLALGCQPRVTARELASRSHTTSLFTMSKNEGLAPRKVPANHRSRSARPTAER
jgi:hypothetical protein